MKNLNKVISGRKNKAQGELLETTIKNVLIRHNWHVMRIPDGCKQVSAFKLIRVKTPFDFIAFKNGKVLAFDVKHSSSKNWTHSDNDQNQLSNLYKIAKQGFNAGYVIHFKDTSMTYFAPVETLIKIEPRERLDLSLCKHILTNFIQTENGIETI